jgi:hypothetical protein
MIRPKYQSTEYLLLFISWILVPDINSTWILNNFTKGLKQNPKILSVHANIYKKISTLFSLLSYPKMTMISQK